MQTKCENLKTNAAKAGICALGLAGDTLKWLGAQAVKLGEILNEKHAEFDAKFKASKASKSANGEPAASGAVAADQKVAQGTDGGTNQNLNADGAGI